MIRAEEALVASAKRAKEILTEEGLEFLEKIIKDLIDIGGNTVCFEYREEDVQSIILSQTILIAHGYDTWVEKNHIDGLDIDVNVINISLLSP